MGERDRSHKLDSGRGDVDVRQKLLMAGKKLFAVHGVEGTTVRDLAQSAGVNISLISYYYGGKEGLYRACIEEFGLERLHHIERVLDQVNSAEDFKVRLRILVSMMMDAQVAEPELSRIVMAEVERGLPVAGDVFERTFLELIQKLTGFVKLAQKKGIIRKNFEPRMFAILLHSYVSHIFRVDAVAKKYFRLSPRDPKDREVFANSLLQIIYDGVLES